MSGLANGAVARFRGRSIASRFVDQMRDKPLADWLEMMAQMDDTWIYSRRPLWRPVPPKKPPVSVVVIAEEWQDQKSERIQRMMAASAVISKRG